MPRLKSGTVESFPNPLGPGACPRLWTSQTVRYRVTGIDATWKNRGTIVSWVSMVRILKSAALYFTLVFGVGFALGPVRILWALPRFGERTAELMESPLMLVAVVLAARWIARRPGSPNTSGGLLAVGVLALGLLLLTELTVMRFLRGFTIEEYVRSRDRVSGSVYLLLLGLFALMPVAVSKLARR